MWSKRGFHELAKQVFTRNRRYDELSQTIHEHLEEKIANLIDRGMTREQAENAGRREFGNLTRIEESSREVWQWPTLESALADVRFVLRQLLRSPGFTITAVTTLGLGIAVYATMFSLVSAFFYHIFPAAIPKISWSQPRSILTRHFRQARIRFRRPTISSGRATSISSLNSPPRMKVGRAVCPVPRPTGACSWPHLLLEQGPPGN